MPGGAPDTFNPFEAPAYAAGGSRGKGKGVTDWDSLEPLAAPTLKARMPQAHPSGHKKRVREDQRMAAAVLSQVGAWCIFFLIYKICNLYKLYYIIADRETRTLMYVGVGVERRRDAGTKEGYECRLVVGGWGAKRV